jgi:hypothetical protein
MARIDLVLRIILADPPAGVVFSKQDKRTRRSMPSWPAAATLPSTSPSP